MSERKAVVKAVDMEETLQQSAIDCAIHALETYPTEREMAVYIKEEFDRKYSFSWHCVVGRNFGSYVTHEARYFIYFYVGQMAFLLFRTA
ncbi:hypothetical protein Zmor_011898 [Zophobas morio]|jgi:dynein light chain LC8-type|uniref:Dynein light chain n=1 Tax=Zophobas morio TaxID=2755281 RepID=A0AA38HLG0_9CUCU|nr:hypothetical protein Zmor_011898 [Zophobas morio]